MALVSVALQKQGGSSKVFLLKWEAIVYEKMLEKQSDVHEKNWHSTVFILKLNTKQWSDSVVSFVPG